MAVSIDDLMADLPSDGSAIRNDLIALAQLLGLPFAPSPTDPFYQVLDTMGRWGTRFWNRYGAVALRAQFGSRAVGDWLTLWMRSKGINRPLATFATGPVTVENRSAGFVDVSAVGAMQIANAGGFTFTSQGPAPGQTGTMAAAVGTTYAQTTLIFQADQVGTASNTAAAALAGFPTTPAFAPPGVYVATNASTPPAPNGAILGSNAMSDAAGYALVQAAQARAASPGSPVSKYVAAALTSSVGGVPVSTNRVSVVGSNAVVTVYCADPGGPSAGDSGTPGTEVFAMNAAIQLACAQPGLTITVQAASALTVALGTVTLYLDAAANVSVAVATANAQAALTLLQSLHPIGGRQKTSGGPGFVLLDEVVSVAMSRPSPTYPAQWVANTYYAVGSAVSNLGQTFVATSAGTSSVAPTGDGGPDGDTGLSWSSTTQTVGSALFQRAPGVFDVAFTGMSGDVSVSVGQVVVFTYTIAVLVVQQSS